MEKRSITPDQFQKGMKRELSEDEQSSWDIRYHQEPEFQTAADAIGNFNQRAGSVEAWRDETLKGDWIRQISSLIFVTVLTGLLLLQHQYVSPPLASLPASDRTCIPDYSIAPGKPDLQSSAVVETMPDSNLSVEERRRYHTTDLNHIVKFVCQAPVIFQSIDVEL